MTARKIAGHFSACKWFHCTLVLTDPYSFCINPKLFKCTLVENDFCPKSFDGPACFPAESPHGQPRRPHNNPAHCQASGKPTTGFSDSLNSSIAQRSSWDCAQPVDRFLHRRTSVLISSSVAALRMSSVSSRRVTEFFLSEVKKWERKLRINAFRNRTG